MTPLWIIVGDGDIFEGHQLHWANTFFSNATRDAIEAALQDENFLDGAKFKLRAMTDAEVLMYPEAVEFEQSLISEYGSP